MTSSLQNMHDCKGWVRPTEAAGWLRKIKFGLIGAHEVQME